MAKTSQPFNLHKTKMFVICAECIFLIKIQNHVNINYSYTHILANHKTTCLFLIKEFQMFSMQMFPISFLFITQFLKSRKYDSFCCCCSNPLNYFYIHPSINGCTASGDGFFWTRWKAFYVAETQMSYRPLC